jgi:DedD protein
MAWPSLFRRKAPAEPLPHPAARQAARRRAGASDAPVSDAEVEAARTRARRRLIGATVLLGIGVIAFPLLFETEPRPIPVDLPIEIPRPDAVPPLALPGAPASSASTASSGAVSSGKVAGTAGDSRPAAPGRSAEATPARADETPAAAATVTERAAEPPAVTAATAPAAPAAPAAATPAPAREAPPAATPRAGDGERAQALLEGRPATVAKSAPTAETPTTGPAAATRYVVQVGAYADDGAVRAVRARVERLGLRTYTQVVRVDAGDRTRVRIGPFDERAQADDVADRLKQAGLPAAVLRL